jgi:hypothetical protein
MPRSDGTFVVGGCGHWSTNLVRRLVDAHSGIGCVPEVTFFRDFSFKAVVCDSLPVLSDPARPAHR